MTVYLKRFASFSAAHNYWLQSLSEAENKERFGVWAAQEGHGHNYRVQATVSGKVDERTGMVVNITDVNAAMKTVVEQIDGKFLNREVMHFAETPTTVENIAQWFYNYLELRLIGGSTLTSVKLWESETLWGSYEQDGMGAMTTRLTRAYDFSASHRLHSKHLSNEENAAIFGKCNSANGHGHNYGVEVTMAGEPNPLTGMVYSIDDLDRIVDEEVLTPFDHKYLNLDTAEFDDLNPTSEMLTVVIWNKLAKRLPVTGPVRLDSVVVIETARNSFEYRGEEAP